MRHIFFLLVTLFTGIGNAAPPVQHSVTVELGPKAYRDGDVVQITNVTATSDRLEQGDTITVTGRARLETADEAQLGLYLTQTQGNGQEETDHTQKVVIQRGLTDFELTTTIKHQGLLHLTFYRTTTGKPFGGVYFGTSEQMKSLSEASVKHYIKD